MTKKRWYKVKLQVICDCEVDICAENTDDLGDQLYDTFPQNGDLPQFSQPTIAAYKIVEVIPE